MKKQETEKPLLIGIGNSAREDDGLGWAFVEKVEHARLYRGDCLYKFQLNLEDAELISRYDPVVFVDAHQGELPQGFSFDRCIPDAGAGFSTHQLSPQSTLYLCQQLYRKKPKAWILAIQGYQWELREGLSRKALGNLDSSLKRFKVWSGTYNKQTFSNSK